MNLFWSACLTFSKCDNNTSFPVAFIATFPENNRDIWYEWRRRSFTHIHVSRAAFKAGLMRMNPTLDWFMIEGLTFTQATANGVYCVCHIIQDIQYKPTSHGFLYEKHRKWSMNWTLPWSTPQLPRRAQQRLHLVTTPITERLQRVTLKLKQLCSDATECFDQQLLKAVEAFRKNSARALLLLHV